MVRYIKLALILAASMALLVFFVGLGVFSILAMLIALPIIRFFYLRDLKKHAKESDSRVIEVEYEIIEDEDDKGGGK